MVVRPFAGTGNRCGHNPLLPRLQLREPTPKGNGGYPRLITLAQEKFEAYFTRPFRFPDLHKRITRIPRSESREACVLLVKALLTKMEILSLSCGYPTPAGFNALRTEDLVSATGMTRRRCERTMSVLVQAGFVRNTQVRGINAQGEYRGCSCHRELTRYFFILLGLDKILDKEQVRKMKDLKISAGMLKKKVSDFFVRFVYRRPYSPQPPNCDENVAYRKAWNQAAAEFMTLYPNAPPDEARRYATEKANMSVR